MPIASYELFNSRPYTYSLTGDGELSRLWMVTGSEDEMAIHAEMATNVIPLEWDDLILKSYDASPLGRGLWLVTAKYGSGLRRGETDDNGDPVNGGQSGGQTLQGLAGDVPSFTFDSGVTSTRMYQSLLTANKLAPVGQTAPDFKGAIGVTDDSVEGCEVLVPSPTWTETHYKSTTSVTPAYRDDLMELVGTCADATFRGRPKGEVLLMSVAGSLKNLTTWELQFKFGFSKNRSNLTVGDITVTTKRGWEYLWIRYSSSVDQNSLIKKPAFVYIEQVYAYADFSKLKIGT